MSDIHDAVPIRDESIRLGQFLKLANLIESGAEAKEVIADGLVSVNGEVEVRRGAAVAGRGCRGDRWDDGSGEFSVLTVGGREPLQEQRLGDGEILDFAGIHTFVGGRG